jgi:hypothetical protein
MATEKPTPMERLERLEVWARRSFIVTTTSGVLLAFIAGHMVYSQIVATNWRTANDARMERDAQELKKEQAALEAKSDAMMAKNSADNAAAIKRMQELKIESDGLMHGLPKRVKAEDVPPVDEQP